TIAAAVGAGGLGVYIFRGLRQYDNNLLLAGAVPAALMALIADFGLGLLERYFSVAPKRRAGTTSGSKKFMVAATAAILAALIIGIYAGSRESRSNSSQPQGARVVVGSKDFT